ncbi:hypothetical protein ACFLZ8_02980 [Planctomycetota bacterium]
MEALKPLLHDLVFPLAIIALWGIIFTVTYRVFSQESYFEGPSAIVLALCISILCILGLFKPFTGEENRNSYPNNSDQDRDIIGAILLIFGFLGFVLCISVILCFAKRLFRRRDTREFPSEIEQRMESLFPFRYINRR